MEQLRTGVIEHPSGTGWTRFAESRPGPAVRGHVRSYTGYEEWSSAPIRRREVPDVWASLIVSFGPRITVVGQGAPRSFVAGVHDAPAITEFTGEQHGVQVRLTPLAAHRILGVPMDAVGFPVVELEDLLGRDGWELAERLAEAPGWTERFATIEDTLRRRLSEAPATPPEVAWVWSRLAASGGRAPLRALRAELGWSDRRLLRAFRTHVGVPPTTFARMVRFRRAIARLQHEGDATLAEIALDCGYYDQPHFNRDFRAFAGGAPSDYVRRLLPDGLGLDGSVQDTAAPRA